MRNRIIIYGSLVLVLVALYAWWSAPRRDAERQRSKAIAELIASNTIAPEVLTNPAAKPWVQPPGVSAADWKNLTLVRHMMLATNKKIEFHARAIDQDGQPVAGVRLDMDLSKINVEKVLREFPNMKMGDELTNETLTLYSDAAGRFALKGVSGRILSITEVSKEGYMWSRPEDLGGLIFEPNDKINASGKVVEIMDALNPAKGYTFHLWKNGATEKLVKVACSVVVEPYGTNWYAVNLFAGQVQDVEAGDFRFWFETKRDTSGNLARQFRFEVPNGGLVADADPYSYLAPESGYMPAWDWYYEPFGRHANQNLQALMKKRFYVKVRNGKVFGAVTWHWGAEGLISITGYLNPTGSRNLEPDPEKLITDPEEIRRLDEQTRGK